jgi:hypothetical protein
MSYRSRFRLRSLGPPQRAIHSRSKPLRWSYDAHAFRFGPSGTESGQRSVSRRRCLRDRTHTSDNLVLDGLHATSIALTFAATDAPTRYCSGFGMFAGGASVLVRQCRSRPRHGCPTHIPPAHPLSTGLAASARRAVKVRVGWGARGPSFEDRTHSFTLGCRRSQPRTSRSGDSSIAQPMNGTGRRARSQL